MSSAVQLPTLVYEIIPDHFASAEGVSPLVAARAHLPHLASLSVDALALTPLLPGHDPLRLHTRSFDGIDPALRARADLAISFGAMVWPHMLVRVMLAEQIYRATTILSGGPYHRT